MTTKSDTATVPAETPAARRAGVYLRISEDRTGKEAGVVRQEKECRELAERLGWQIVDYYADNGISAYNGKRRRPQYERLKDDLRAGRIDAIVAWHPDRMYRQAKELEAVIDLIAETKSKVATVQTGDVDLSSPNGRLVARIGASVAQHESEHKGERVRAWHRQRAEAGFPNGGIRPFGFRPDRLTIDETEAALVREAAARRLAGETGFSVVADWNARGLRTVTGKPWTVSSLGAVLRGPRIAGLREHHGRLHPGVWPAIVGRDDWDALRAMRGTNGHRGRPPMYLLTGMARCGACEAKMSTSATGTRANGKTRTIVCGGPQTNGGGCGKVGAHAERVEEVVTRKVLEAFDGAPLAERVAAKAGSDDETREVLAALATLEGRLKTLKVEYSVEQLWSKSEFIAHKAELEERMADLSGRLDQAGQFVAAGRLPAGVSDLRAWWPDAAMADRRTVVALVVDRVVIKPVGRGGNRFDEDRVDIRWKA